MVDELAALVEAKTLGREFQVISGGEVADLLFSIPVSMRLGKPHVVIRKSAKTHGLGGRIAGVLEKGQTVAHVSDLITSGTSAMDWVGVIRGAGCIVRDYFVVVDRRQGGTEALGAAGVKVHSLVPLDSRFIQPAMDEGLLDKESAKEVESYLKDPEKWAESLLRSRPEVLERHLAAADGKLVRSEGVEILTVGYPALLGPLGGFLRGRLKSLGVRERIDSLGYEPSP